MKKLWNDKIVLLGIIFACFILFLPGFFTYFHQDDFIHMSVSQRFDQVVNSFNIFQEGEFPFYRPLPTQVYFYFNKLLFGYNPLGYHVVNFLIFAANIFLVHRLIRLISGKNSVGFIASFFYAINSTHVAPLYSPAYVHELMYVFFGLCTVFLYAKYVTKLKPKYLIGSVLLFVLALMTKETAVVLPGILLLVQCTLKGFHLKYIRNIIPFAVIEAIYLFAHFVYYGIAQSPSYQFMIGKPTINALVWYFLWSLSVPSILIDFFGPGIKINPTFFQVAGIHGWIFILVFPALLILFIMRAGGMLQNIKKQSQELRLIILGIAWFTVGLIPLLIFPLHHLATEQAFSLVGVSLAIGILISGNSSPSLNVRGGRGALLYLLVFLYLVIAVNSILLARKTHWIVLSARQAKNVVDHFRANYPDIANDTTIYFLDGEIKIPQYGSSKQLYQALGDGKALNIIFDRPSLTAYYEFQDGNFQEKIKPGDIVIRSSDFLGY